MEHCENHAECTTRISQCEQCIQNIKREQVKVVTLLEERTSTIMAEMKKGSDRFKEQGDHIAKIREDIAALVAVARTSDRLFQR